jgi:hypothetical protein
MKQGYIKQGYEVLRLPPYHCQCNPIEMVWGYYNKHIRSQPRSKDKVTNLWKTALSNYRYTANVGK